MLEIHFILFPFSPPTVSYELFIYKEKTIVNICELRHYFGRWQDSLKCDSNVCLYLTFCITNVFRHHERDMITFSVRFGNDGYESLTVIIFNN